MSDDGSKLNRIESKIDRLDERLDKFDVHMAVYNEQLQIHIEGVRRLDKRVRPLEARFDFESNVLKFVKATSKVLAAVGGLILLAKQLGIF
jgi:predicted nuclease with TOPRIM domain